MIHFSLFGVDWGQFILSLLIYLGSYFGTKHGNNDGGSPLIPKL